MPLRALASTIVTAFVIANVIAMFPAYSEVLRTYDQGREGRRDSTGVLALGGQHLAPFSVSIVFEGVE